MAVEEYLDDDERQEYAEEPEVSDGSNDYGSDYYDSDYATDPPSGEPSDDNPLIPITLTNEDGEEYVEEIAYADLAEIVKKAKSGGKGQAGNIPEGSVEYQGAVTLLKEIQQNDLVKKVLAYQSQGYSDDQIIAGMFQLTSQSKAGDAPPEFATLKDEVNHYVAQALNQHIEPIKQDMNKQKWAAARDYATRNNNNVMASALQKFGFADEQITDKHLEKMVGALKSLYPEEHLERLGYTYDTYPLSHEQAEGIVALAFGGSKKPEGKQGSNSRAAATLSKMQQLPKIMPGKSTDKSPEQGPRQRDNVSRSERLKRINELLQ